ncbi:MAG: hypothetical protein IPM16_19855 [Chloroflexi bacterium]|nr:hypothetical protein [Chloroflexota bacterium]
MRAFDAIRQIPEFRAAVQVVFDRRLAFDRARHVEHQQAERTEDYGHLDRIGNDVVNQAYHRNNPRHHCDEVAFEIAPRTQIATDTVEHAGDGSKHGGLLIAVPHSSTRTAARRTNVRKFVRTFQH